MQPEPLNRSQLILELRQQLNLSQANLAARLGVSFRTVNRWENGHTQPSPMAVKLLENLVQQLSEPHQNRLKHYFSQGAPRL